MIPPFHLAFPVDDLDAARRFYVGMLGCREGRSSEHWIDFDLFGHQIVAHFVKSNPNDGQNDGFPGDAGNNRVDGHDVPVPHFGVVLTWELWQELAEQLRQAGVQFEIEPSVRFRDQPGEQGTMFFRDPAGNALEFKSFRDLDQLFAR